jgi:SulP family sulfate permease
MIALLEAKAAGLFGRAHIANNVLAGLVVGIVALPLALAFAIASGARPEQGLYTAIVAGLITSLFGGTRVQISGPTGAFIAVLAGITSRHGVAGLQLATLMAGVILLAMGLARPRGLLGCWSMLSTAPYFLAQPLGLSTFSTISNINRRCTR